MIPSEPTSVTVAGMSCAHCERAIVQELTALSTVTTATADHATGTVTITGTPSHAEVTAAVQAAGYELA
jgi:copper chaperone CopZ